MAHKHGSLVKPAAGLIFVGAAMAWLSSRMTWLEVQAFDDKAGEQLVPIVGGTWSTELSAVALILLAGCIAGMALRVWGRRIVGVIVALAAAGGAISAVQVLVGTPSFDRAHQILTSGSATGHLRDGAALNSWAEITHITVQPLAAVLALLGCGLALVGGVLLALRPGHNRPADTQYERAAARKERAKENLAEDPDSERIMWDAIDADLDPTTDPSTDARG
ncbi:TIGR02234 family membrane protein [Corynebacterium kozikiae]|uniref:TIGR02234 family membrane protein n=1 Tax=Corynebacterium kozikiae TaxID=2968469 RepID=UPI00211BDD1D|nr:TIGR02234 family membrane protein [Corynebacterium sp. 76QC2CO]